MPLIWGERNMTNLRHWSGGIRPAMVVFAAVCVCLLGGCSEGERRPSGEDLAKFEAAGLKGPSIDLDRVTQARITPGPYHVTTGDVLQLQIDVPGAMSQGQALEDMGAPNRRQSYTCRVRDDGAILLPVVGRIEAAGKSLGEIEAAVGSEYYPKYVKTPVPVYVSVLEYRTRRVSVVGAVTRPGIYALRHEQMSLVSLLMEAGGISDKGAAMIRISRPNRPAATQTGVYPSVGSDRDSGQGQTSRAAAPARAFLSYEENLVPIVAVFQREGSLSTTGWLTLRDEYGSESRTWLDIGNASQRRSLRTAPMPAKAGLEVQDNLETKLTQLADDLEAGSQGRPIPLRIPDAGWKRMEAGRFVTVLPAPAGPGSTAGGRNPIQLAGMPEPETQGTTVVLPVRGLNIPFADVALDEGDSVVVEWPEEQFVSVVGLVNRPGNYPYPSNARYTLIQAIALAGDLNAVADPHYVSVYRLGADGAIASVTVQFMNPGDKQQLTEALAMPLRPGDIVSVESTLRTRTNVFFDRIFRISLGLYVAPNDLWR
jgi:protein involved in polysaccharide export with SLBB domain